MTSTRDQDRRRTAARSDSPAAVEAVLRDLARALDAPSGTAGLRVDRKRLAGRSNIYFISSSTPLRGHQRFVVKQPHLDWSQADLDTPVSAREELRALTRLHTHFPGPELRVPEPVAYLPVVQALTMEFVPGRTLRELLNYGAALRPKVLLDGVAAAGRFLRHLHALEELAAHPVDLRDEALKVLEISAAVLEPQGLALPPAVRRTLEQLPGRVVVSRRVRLHGDFGPGNILLGDDGSTVGLDAALTPLGPPEQDLVRFVALLCGSVRLAPELLFPPASLVRHRLESQFLRSYYGPAPAPPLFEVLYLQQLARRWCRLRELAQRSQSAPLLPTRLHVIGAQMSLLMRESARRLVRGTR